MDQVPVIYRQCGLRIRSVVPLDLPRVDDGEWDVELVRGPDITRTDEPPLGELIAERVSPDGSGWWYRVTETADGFCLRFVNCADVVVSTDFTRVEVRADSAGRDHLLPVLLAGTLTAFLLTMRGATVLHASAVAVDGSALAFVGPSGKGKTTLATLMCLAGATMVADDVLIVDPGPPATCEGGASELRLREAAATLASDHAAAVTRRTSDNRLALSVGTPFVGPLPLVAIVVPAPSREATAVELHAVPPDAALMGLVSLARVEGWSHPQVIERDFGRLAALVNGVPVFNAVVPWGPPFSPTVASELAALATAVTSTRS